MWFVTYVLFNIKKKLKNKIPLITKAIVSTLLVAALIPLSAVVFEETSRVTRFSIAIVDEEQSFYTQLFINKIITSPSIQNNLDAIVTSRQNAEELIKNNEIVGFVVIPEYFTESIKGGKYKPFQLWLNYNTPLKARLIEEGMKSGTYMMSAVQYALYSVYSYLSILPLEKNELDLLFQSEMLVLATDALSRSNIFSRENKTPWLDLTLTDYYVLSLAILFISLFGYEIIFSFYFDEKNNVNRRLILLQKNYFCIMSGNIIASSIVLFIQGCLLLTPLLFSGKYFYLLPVLFLISVQTSVFNMLLANISYPAISGRNSSPNPRIASTVSVLAALIQAFFAGLLIPLNLLPFLPNSIKFITTHFWQQQLLISIYTSENGILINLSLIVVLIITSVLFLLLGGVAHVKYKSRY